MLLTHTATVQGCHSAPASGLQCASQTRYSLALAQFYMWAQTPHSVMLAVFIPTGTLHLSLRAHTEPFFRCQT